MEIPKHIINSAKEFGVSPSTLKGAQVSGTIAGKSDALHGRPPRPPDPVNSDIASWTQERIAYVAAYEDVASQKE